MNSNGKPDVSKMDKNEPVMCAKYSYMKWGTVHCLKQYSKSVKTKISYYRTTFDKKKFQRFCFRRVLWYAYLSSVCLSVEIWLLNAGLMEQIDQYFSIWLWPPEDSVDCVWFTLAHTELFKANMQPKKQMLLTRISQDRISIILIFVLFLMM